MMDEITRYNTRLYKSAGGGSTEQLSGDIQISSADFEGFVLHEPVPGIEGTVYQGLIKTGGLGLIHKVYDPVKSTAMALKIPKRAIWDKPELLGLFEKEAAEYRKIQPSPYIVNPLNYKSINGIPHLFLEYVQGGNLRQLLNRTKASEEPRDRTLNRNMLRYLCISIAKALDHAHSYQVLHGDLKPENVMIEEGTGSVKLIDFGGDAGTGIFTPAYASPEHTTPDKYTTRSDIYCFGLIMFELLTGTIFNRDKILKLPGFVSSGEKEIIRYCLAENPDQRPENAGALVRMLEAEYGTFDTAADDPAERLKERGTFLFTGEKYQEAADTFRDCNNLRNGADKEFYSMWAYALLRTGNLDEAIKIAESGEYPGMNDTSRRSLESIRAICSWHSDEKRQTMKRYEIILAQKKDPYIMRNLADLYAAVGWYTKARDLYISAAETGSHDAELTAAAAGFFFINGAYGKAWEYIEKAIEKNPREINYYFGLKDIINRLYGENSDDIHGVVRRAWENAVDTVPLSIFEANIGDINDQKKEALRLLQEKPDHPQVLPWAKQVLSTDRNYDWLMEEPTEKTNDFFSAPAEIEQLIRNGDLPAAEKLLVAYPQGTSKRLELEGYLEQARQGISDYGRVYPKALREDLYTRYPRPEKRELKGDKVKFAVISPESNVEEDVRIASYLYGTDEEFRAGVDRAFELYGKAMDRDPFNVTCLLKALKLHLMLGQQDAAEKLYRLALEEHGENLGFLQSLASIFPVEETLYQRAVETESEWIWRWISATASNIQLAPDETAEKLTELEHQVQEMPRLGDYYWWYGRQLARRSEKYTCDTLRKKSVIFLEKARERLGDKPQLLSDLALAYKNAGNEGAAKKWNEEAARAGHLDALYNLIHGLLEKGEFETVLEWEDAFSNKHRPSELKFPYNGILIMFISAAWILGRRKQAFNGLRSIVSVYAEQKNRGVKTKVLHVKKPNTFIATLFVDELLQIEIISKKGQERISYEMFLELLTQCSDAMEAEDPLLPLLQNEITVFRILNDSFDIQDADEIFRSPAQQNRTYFHTFNLGVIYWNKEPWRKLFNVFTLIPLENGECEEFNKQWLEMLTRAAELSGREPEAVEHAKRLTEINKLSAYERRNILLKGKEYQFIVDKLNELEKAVLQGLFDSMPEVRITRAEALAHLGKKEEAERDVKIAAENILQLKNLEQAIGREKNRGYPGGPIHYFAWAFAMWICKVYKITENIPEARKICRQVLDMFPENDEIYNWVGVFYNSIGDVPEAIKLCQRAFSLEPKPVYATNIAEILKKQDKHTEAAAFLEKAILTLPGNTKINAMLGDLYYPVDRKRAAGYFAQCEAAKIGAVQTLNNAGITLFKLNRNKEALPFFEKAEKLSPKSPTAKDNIMHTLRRLGRYEEALPYAIAAVKMTPDDDARNYHAALTLYNMERYDEALNYIRKACEINPENAENMKLKKTIESSI
jgi:tetratricopeptide (TPR) repeat protein